MPATFNLDIGDILGMMLKWKILSDEMNLRKQAAEQTSTKYIEDYPALSWRELGRTFGEPEVERYKKARGITQPELPFGKVKSPYSGVVSQYQETKPPGYGPERLLKAGEQQYLEQPGKVEEQTKVKYGEARTKVAEQAFQFEQNKAKSHLIASLASQDFEKTVNGQTVQATTKDLEDYADSLLSPPKEGEKEKPKIELTPGITQQRQWMMVYKDLDKYSHLEGKKVSDLTPEDRSVLPRLAKFGGAYVDETGVIRFIKVEKPSLNTVTRAPDPNIKKNISGIDESRYNPDDFEVVDVVQNGVRISSVVRKRKEPKEAELLPSSLTKDLERLATRGMLGTAYENYKKDPENKNRLEWAKFMDSISTRDPITGISEPHLPNVQKYLTKEENERVENAILGASRLLTSKKELDPTSAYNRAWVESGKLIYTDGKSTWAVPYNELGEFLRLHPNAKEVQKVK